MLLEIQRQLGGGGAAGAASVPRVVWLMTMAASAMVLRRLA